MPFRLLRSGFLLCVVLVPTLYLAFSLTQQRWIKWEMQEKLEKSQLTTLTLSTHSIQWAKKGKEMLIDGKLFDVKSIAVVNGLATIKGLFDEEETSLSKRIDNLLQQQHSSRQLKTCLICSILIGFPSSDYATSINFFDASSKIFVGHNSSYYSSPFLEFITPPPQS